MLRLLLVTATFTGYVVAQRGLPQNIVDDIGSNRDAADDIMQYLLEGDGKGEAYKRLGNFVDHFPHRFTGDPRFEEAIDYVVQKLEEENFDDVHTEDVEVPVWVRGEEYATLLTPEPYDIEVLGLMFSIATPPQGITAQVLVVKSFEELADRAEEARGKIIVYNQEWTNYGDGAAYRGDGAVEAAKVGGVASLIRSVTQLSIYSPHTGGQYYQDGIEPIPTGCITVEDAELLQRFQDRGEPLELLLYMNHTNKDPAISRNIIADLRGSEHPDELVIIGGHIDAWDIAQGAMDDGGGCIVSWQVLTALKALNLRPKRTIRLVLWTAEEVGLVGGYAFHEKHKANAGNISIAMESDAGTFAPRGLGIAGSGLTQAILEEILQFLEPIGATLVDPDAPPPPDIMMWVEDGVPVSGLLNQDETYFYYHHTLGDSMTIEDPDELDQCSALWTVAAYVIANLEDKLPREGEYPVSGAVTSAALHPILYIAVVYFFLLGNRESSESCT